LTAPESTGEGWSGDRRDYVPRFYRRGSVALAAGIEAARRYANSLTATVWVPDYFCNEALDFVRRGPATLKFYPVREDLTPDWEKLNDWVKSDSELQVFVLVHYFGFPNASCEAKKFCDGHGMVFFEDSAHMLQPGAGVGLGDLMILSPRKLLPVPFVGLLLASDKFVTLLDTPAGDNDRIETLGWILRRVTQRVLVKLRFPWHRLMNYEEAGAATDDDRSNNHGDGCSSYALRLLTVTTREMNEVIARRRQNYARLLEWSAELTQIRPLFPLVPDGVCPYAFPVLVDRGYKNVVAQLQAQGILASRWPDLPPELSVEPAEHRIAFRTYEQLMLLPVHQSLNDKQIDIVGKSLRVALAPAG
jgi:hypothetical protein